MIASWGDGCFPCRAPAKNFFLSQVNWRRWMNEFRKQSSSTVPNSTWCSDALASCTGKEAHWINWCVMIRPTVSYLSVICGRSFKVCDHPRITWRTPSPLESSSSNVGTSITCLSLYKRKSSGTIVYCELRCIMSPWALHFVLSSLPPIHNNLYLKTCIAVLGWL